MGVIVIVPSLSLRALYSHEGSHGDFFAKYTEQSFHALFVSFDTHFSHSRALIILTTATVGGLDLEEEQSFVQQRQC